jgi:hypothetical protein
MDLLVAMVEERGASIVGQDGSERSGHLIGIKGRAAGACRCPMPDAGVRPSLHRSRAWFEAALRYSVNVVVVAVVDYTVQRFV